MADNSNDSTTKAPSTATEAIPVPKLPPPVRKKHSLKIRSTVLNYTSTTGTMKLESDDGKHRADVFFVAYTKDKVSPAKRPITFAFNGGPGSSSVWLHLGALGPRRVVMDDIGNPLPAPHSLCDNEFTWLQWTDLVFIDPVGTGYSRPAGDSKREEFHGVAEDVASVAEFIRRWTSENSRWLSPKFLAGESYGTTRAAALCNTLQHEQGMSISGAMLISAVLSFQTISHKHSTVNDLPYVSFLPAIAATSWYHKRLNSRYQKNLPLLLKEAREFAGKDYLLSLAQGHRLSAAEKEAIALRLSELSGLSVSYILSCNLRIHPMRYMKELLRDVRKTVGRLDSRFIGSDSDAAGELTQDDPSYLNILGVYTAGVNDYIRRELGYETPIAYEVLTPKVHPWKWGDADKGYVNVADDLAEAMRNNQHLKVWVANGYFDLATPFFGTEWTFNHLEIESKELTRVWMTYYESGHMMYIHKPSLVQMTKDAETFIKSCL